MKEVFAVIGVWVLGSCVFAFAIASMGMKINRDKERDHERQGNK